MKFLFSPKINKKQKKKKKKEQNLVLFSAEIGNLSRQPVLPQRLLKVEVVCPMLSILTGQQNKCKIHYNP